MFAPQIYIRYRSIPESIFVVEIKITTNLSYRLQNRQSTMAPYMLLPSHDMKVGDSFWVDSSSRSPLLSGSIKQQQLLQETEMSKWRQVFFVPVLLSFCSALLCFILRPLHIDHASRSLILVWITAPLPQKYNRMT